jgi:MFS family permease
MYYAMRRFGQDYVRGLGMATRNNALAYGYSVTITTSFGLLTATAHSPNVGHIFLFIIGSGIAFAGVNALVTRGFRRRVKEEPPVVMALATSFSFLSISAGAGVATLIGWGIGGWLSWLLGSLLATWSYLSVSALEVASARLLHITVGGRELARR